VDIIITGHTHHYSEEWIDGRLWLNPGKCGVPRFGTEVTMAVITVDNQAISVQRINLEP
jgi:putative phosphoesterase